MHTVSHAKFKRERHVLFLTVDEFTASFELEQNHHTQTSAWDNCAYAPYGEEQAYINKLSHSILDHVWTATEAEGKTYILSGVHKHPLYYLVSINPIATTVQYIVPIPLQSLTTMKKRTTYQSENITIDLEEFAEKFTLKKNHLANVSLNRGHSFETFIWRGCAFETFGEELQYIRSQPESTIWTIIENNNNSYIWSGLHYFDPVCYLLSEERVPDTIQYIIHLL